MPVWMKVATVALVVVTAAVVAWALYMGSLIDA